MSEHYQPPMIVEPFKVASPSRSAGSVMESLKVAMLRLVCLGASAHTYRLVIERGRPEDYFVGPLLIAVLLIVYSEARYFVRPEEDYEATPGGTP